MLRFTDTNKWEKPWFRGLHPDLKLAWLFLLDKVDAAGVWELDNELFRFMTGIEVEDLCSHMNKLAPNAAVIKGGKVVVHKFIHFQCRGSLNPNHPPHKAIFKALEKHGLELTADNRPDLSGLCSIETLNDEAQICAILQDGLEAILECTDNEDPKAIAQETLECLAISKGHPTLKKASAKPLRTEEEKEQTKKEEGKLDCWHVINLWNKVCTERPQVRVLNPSRRSAIRKRWAGFDVGEAKLDEFEAVFTAVQKSDFLSGRSGKWIGACFDWVMKEKNWVKIMEGNYNDQSKKRQANSETW